MSYKTLIQKGRWFIQFKEDYSNVFSPSFFNWVEFTFVKFYVENNRLFGIFEVEACLLGLGFNIQFVHNKKRLYGKMEEYDKMLESEKFIKM